MVIGKDWQDIKCLGSTTMGPRGQVVVPAHARKELGINPGETLLVFSGPGKQVLVFLKADTVEQILNSMSEHLAGFAKVVEDYRTPKTEKRK